MPKIILVSSNNCYEFFNENENSTECGSTEELVSRGADIDSIRWSNYEWCNQLDYFFEYLQSEIDKYEERWGTSVKGIALIGTVGTWRGNHFGGKVYNIKDITKILSMDVDSIEVMAEDDGIIWILGYHHDGTHRMKIHFLTENKLRRAGLSQDTTSHCNVTVGDLERLEDVLKPLVLRKNNKYYTEVKTKDGCK